jgi:hypothetical protein
MQRTLKNKTFLLIAGLAIGLVTLFSHSLRVEIGQVKKQTSEQSSEGPSQTIIVAPSLAVTVNLFSFHVDGWFVNAPSFYPIKKVLKVVPSFQKAATDFFQTLFRYIISPNAP